MPYTVAVALVHGTVEAYHFDEACLNDPAIRALTRRVKAQASKEADRRMPEAMLCKLTLVTHSGARYTAVVEYHKGHWRNPMSESEVEEKFRKLSAKVLTSDRTDRLLERLWHLENVQDAGEIVRLTVNKAT
jgi:2-methylcitrate dehydratase